MRRLYQQIWQHTGSVQLQLIALPIFVAAIAALPLKFQKEIINGLSDQMAHQQLVALCLSYLAVVLFSNGLKLLLNFISARLGESCIRQIRLGQTQRWHDTRSYASILKLAQAHYSQSVLS